MKWLEGIDLDGTDQLSPTSTFTLDEEAFCKEIGSKSAESLHVTMGLLVTMYAESRGGKFGTGLKPNVSNIAKEIAKFSEERNSGCPLSGQSYESIKGRVEVALSAFKSNIYILFSSYKYYW